MVLRDIITYVSGGLDLNVKLEIDIANSGCLVTQRLNKNKTLVHW